MLNWDAAFKIKIKFWLFIIRLKARYCFWDSLTTFYSAWNRLGKAVSGMRCSTNGLTAFLSGIPEKKHLYYFSDKRKLWKLLNSGFCWTWWRNRQALTTTAPLTCQHRMNGRHPTIAVTSGETLKNKKTSEDLWSRDPPWNTHACSLEASISSSFTELLCF